MKRCSVRGLLACLMTTLVLVSGCASTGTPVARDPLESVNRAVFSVNDRIDAMVLHDRRVRRVEQLVLPYEAIEHRLLVGRDVVVVHERLFLHRLRRRAA